MTLSIIEFGRQLRAVCVLVKNSHDLESGLAVGWHVRIIDDAAGTDHSDRDRVFWRRPRLLQGLGGTHDGVLFQFNL